MPLSWRRIRKTIKRFIQLDRPRYLVSSYCGKCGYSLGKHPGTDKNGRHNFFTCETSIKRKKLAAEKGCKQSKVRESEILPVILKHLVEEVDRAELQRHNVKAPDSPGSQTDIAQLKVKAKALTQRIERAEEESLGTPQSPKKDRQKAILAKLENELELLQREIQNLCITDGDSEEFSSWWQEIRTELVWVLDNETVWKEITPEVIPDMMEGTQFVLSEDKRFPEGFESTGKIYIGKGARVSVETKPAVVMDQARFRNLLKSLGCKVNLFWKPKSITNRAGKTYESKHFTELSHATILIGGKTFSHDITSIASRGAWRKPEPGR